MGSPNFYTNTPYLNVAIQIDYDLPDEELDSEQNHINWLKNKMEEFINNLPTLFWHSIEIHNGYHSGFQVYLDPDWKCIDKFIGCKLEDWQKYSCFADREGYDVELDECPYLRKNIKNLTAHELKRAIKREEKELHNLLLKAAKEYGLGQVIGSSWTSCVEYPIQAKLMS